MSSNPILVAEDNEANRLLALKQLERLGYSADAVADGAQAVDAVAAHSYALVLMDCNMPQLDGFAATRAIRAAESGTHRHTIIVAMTAGAMDDDRAACLDAGMDDYLCKPVMLADLKHVFSRWLDGEGPAEAPKAEATAISQTPGASAPPDPVHQETFDRFRGEVGGDQFAALFVQVYLGELDGRLDGLRQARADADAELMGRLAHTLKSTSATLGALRLADLCRELEGEAVDPTASRAGNLIEDVREEAGAVRQSLRRLGFESQDAVA